MKPAANPNSNVKQAAASILKTSLNKAKLEGLRAKRNSNALQRGQEKEERATSGLRGKLLSSGFSSYADDEEDIEERRAYDSDDGTEDGQNGKATQQRTESEWKQIERKLDEQSKGKRANIIEKEVYSPTKTPAVDSLFR